MIALLDLDIIAYRSSASCEPTMVKHFLEPKELALLRCEDLIQRILHETGATSYKGYLGGEDNFRYKIYPEYKANRSNKPKPTWLQDVREYLVTEHNAIICDGIEADDALGIEQTFLYNEVSAGFGFQALMKEEGKSLAESNRTSIICSIDKDLLQIPGWHYNFVTGVKSFTDELTGLKYFYQQLIQGDQSDNIPGYDGLMRPKIPKFLQPKIDELWDCNNERDMWELVWGMYGEAPQIFINAQLLYIQRKEGDKWHPPVTL